MEDGLASEACSEPVDLLAAVESAAEELDSHDPYRQQLVSWLSDLASLDDGERPPKPPKLDTRKLGKVLEARRKAARAAALEYCQSLHEDWTASNAQRIADRTAVRDSTRDWAHERATQSERKEQREWRASIIESAREWREKKENEERQRQERRAADEHMVQRHRSVYATQRQRNDLRQQRQRQWASRRRPAQSSTDSDASDSDDPFRAHRIVSAAERRDAKRCRHASRKPVRELTANEIVAGVVDRIIAELERTQRKADVVADGFTLYDEDFYRIDPRTRKHDDEKRAFVAYPDGSRCWVHRPFDTSDPNGNRLLGWVKQPHHLVQPWAIQRDFCSPQQIDGASTGEVAQVCVLLRSLSKLLTLRGNALGSNLYALAANRWIENNLLVTRCTDHDWCQELRVPCDTDSPERVLVAVLGQHSEVWSISWLAKVWQSSRHQDGISAFVRHGRVTEPIRPLPPGYLPRPPRSLLELAASSDANSCGHSTRTFRPDANVQCGDVPLPPPPTRVSLGMKCDPPCKAQERTKAPRLFSCGHPPCPRAYEYKLEIRGHLGYPVYPNAAEVEHARRSVPVSVEVWLDVPQREIDLEWRRRFICVCDASVEEMELVHEAILKHKDMQEKVHARKCAEIFRNHARGLKAAATRRENERKRRREEKAEARKQNPLGSFKKRQKGAHEDCTLSDAFSDSRSVGDAKEAAYLSEGGTVHGMDWD